MVMCFCLGIVDGIIIRVVDRGLVDYFNDAVKTINNYITQELLVI